MRKIWHALSVGVMATGAILSILVLLLGTATAKGVMVPIALVIALRALLASFLAIGIVDTIIGSIRK